MGDDLVSTYARLVLLKKFRYDDMSRNRKSFRESTFELVMDIKLLSWTLYTLK